MQEAYGGFNSSRVVEDYVYYADVVFKHLGRYVGAGDWISFNEPLVTCDLGFKAGEGLDLGRQCALSPAEALLAHADTRLLSLAVGKSHSLWLAAGGRAALPRLTPAPRS